MRAVLATLCVGLGVGCSAAPLELSVDVRTDLLPGVDFTSAQIELATGLTASREARAGDPFWRGVRVADFANVPLGDTRVRATLLAAGGKEILSRNVQLELDSSYALTVVLTADCVENSCPGTSEPGSYTECLSGRCVEPRCGGSTGEGCGDLECRTHAECEGFVCVAACVAGACACVGSAPDGAVTPLDGGPCTGECTPGETEEEMQACGECGEGIERRTRTCGPDCRWGDYGEYGECETDAECSPGETESRSADCGRCGNKDQSRSCESTCKWSDWVDAGACSDQGVCEPGTTRGGCDISYEGTPTSCGVQVCGSRCTWGSCQLAPGATCLAERGNNFRCCTPSGGGSGWQFCNRGCTWNNCAAHSC